LPLSVFQSKTWLRVPVILKAFVDNILPALVFLESRDMVCRDVTAYNMVIYSQSPARAGAKADGVFSGDFIIKLADLGLTDKFRENGHIRPCKHVAFDLLCFFFN
jgi:hypothetical protein